MISEKIVVIDDDPRVIKSIKMIFREYEIIDFDNGNDALRFLAKPNFINVVLLDVMMPKGNGLIVLEEIKKQNKNIAVIMMTAYGSKDVAVEALRYRADDFVEKPFDFKELKEKITFLLKEKSYSKNLRKDKNDQVDRIKRFVDRNCKDANLETIADEMCLSPKYVSRLFNEKTNSSFRKYKVETKMEKAKVMLKKTRLNVDEIAVELGYQNPESFMRIFKRITKLTPTQFRKMKRI